MEKGNSRKGANVVRHPPKARVVSATAFSQLMIISLFVTIGWCSATQRIHRGRVSWLLCSVASQRHIVGTQVRFLNESERLDVESLLVTSHGSDPECWIPKPSCYSSSQRRWKPGWIGCAGQHTGTLIIHTEQPSDANPETWAFLSASCWPVSQGQPLSYGHIQVSVDCITCLSAYNWWVAIWRDWGPQSSLHVIFWKRTAVPFPKVSHMKTSAKFTVVGNFHLCMGH